MKSFSKTLVRNFIGLIFVIFMVVYFSFNLITNNFISTEAQRELANSVAAIEILANRVEPGVFRATGALPMPEIMEEFATHATQWYSQRQLLMNTDGIIIHENEIILPVLHLMSEETAAEINFLFDYVKENSVSFANENMVRVISENNAYYIKAIRVVSRYWPYDPDHVSFTVLLYTDITSAILFMRHINRTLGALLIISGVVSAIISILLSSKVRGAIARLRKHAEIIGHGNFVENAENFDFKEFSALAQSMNTMADKLDTYEKNQKQFFQNVSHELRTPLMSIQGYADCIIEDIVNKNEASEIILAESERMEILVNQLLYISRLDSGLDVLNITTFGIKNMLYDCVWRIKVLAEKNSKEIIFNFPDVNAEIKSDEEKLQRVIENVLTNCIRHANEKIKISYSTKDNLIEIIIEDDGEGFNENELPHLFERFYKGANGNLGLGLAICKDIIEKLGGNIKAENITDFSDNTKGAVFVITIPVN